MSVRKKSTPTPIEPLTISPQRTAELTSLSLTKVYDKIASGEFASTLKDGRRLVDFQSVKRAVAPSKIRQTRAGAPAKGERKGGLKGQLKGQRSNAQAV